MIDEYKIIFLKLGSKDRFLYYYYLITDYEDNRISNYLSIFISYYYIINQYSNKRNSKLEGINSVLNQ